MSRHIFKSLILISFLFCANSHASIDMVVNALGHANGALMASPPLPVAGKKGGSDFVIQVGSFSEPEKAEGDIKELNYSGYSAAFLYFNYLSTNWGFYIMGNAASISGSIVSPGSTEISNSKITASEINSQIMLAGLGISYSLLNNSAITMPIFLGPSIIAGDLSAHIVQTSGNTVVDEFDSTSQPSIAGVTAGVQIALHVSSFMSIVPYAMVSQAADEESLCQPFTATNITTNGGLVDASGEHCDTNNAKSMVQFNAFVQSYGVNFSFPTLGLNLNVYSDFGEMEYFEGTQLNKMSLSITF